MNTSPQVIHRWAQICGLLDCQASPEFLRRLFTEAALLSRSSHRCDACSGSAVEFALGPAEESFVCDECGSKDNVKWYHTPIPRVLRMREETEKMLKDRFIHVTDSMREQAARCAMEPAYPRTNK